MQRACLLFAILLASTFLWVGLSAADGVLAIGVAPNGMSQGGAEGRAVGADAGRKALRNLSGARRSRNGARAAERGQ